MEVKEFRNSINTEIFKLKTTIEPVSKICTIHIPHEEHDIPARIYTPEGDDLFPLVIFLHGAAWVAGNLETHDNICRRFASRVPSVVLSVDYRLAPESKFPIPLQDSYRALVWAAENARSINADHDRLAVAGDSAGGNLAAAVCMMARDRCFPEIRFQLLVNPALDFSAYDGEGFEDMKWYGEQYLRDTIDIVHPYASPLLAKSLSGLPQAFIITCEFDILSDEGEAYATRLREAGVAVDVYRQAGMDHLAGQFARATDEAKEVVDLSVAALQGVFKI